MMSKIAIGANGLQATTVRRRRVTALGTIEETRAWLVEVTPDAGLAGLCHRLIEGPSRDGRK
jgi:hypothetical protein